MKLFCSSCGEFICKGIEKYQDSPIISIWELKTDTIGDGASAICRSCEEKLI
jgi:hypothetical protein